MKVLYPYDNKRIIELDKERGLPFLTRKEVMKMVRRRLTPSEIWEKLDDIVGLITGLIYTCSDKESEYLENACDELTKLMDMLENKIRKEKR